MSGRLIVVGAGQAAFALVAKLRALNDLRPITIIGSETVLPYQRPPLSKKYLMGEMEFDRLLYRTAEWYVDNNVDILLGRFVEEIDRAKKSVRLNDGLELDYDKLAIATGAEPRRLPDDVGGDLQGVYTIRSKHDADQLMGEMVPNRKLLVIGGGYIGLEAAAVAKSLGLEVTLVEMADRILQRVASEKTATLMRDIHVSHGVTILEKTGLITLLGQDGRVVGAQLSNGQTIDVDCVIVGIGVLPNDRLARESGLETTNGIVVDQYTRTSDPDIHALGDVSVLPWKGQMIRLESVQNAVDQAETAAFVLSGDERAYVAKPWFWSDQYDVKLQIAGFNLGYDETIFRPGQREGSSSVWYFRNGSLIAVDAINDAKAYVTGKKLLDNSIVPDQSIIADLSSDLKILLM